MTQAPLLSRPEVDDSSLGLPIGRGPAYPMATMDSALVVDRLHFAFTVTFHYLFPQLTMGLALLLVILKTLGLTDRQSTL
jgi:hypothetical protein